MALTPAGWLLADVKIDPQLIFYAIFLVLSIIGGLIQSRQKQTPQDQQDRPDGADETTSQSPPPPQPVPPAPRPVPAPRRQREERPRPRPVRQEPPREPGRAYEQEAAARRNVEEAAARMAHRIQANSDPSRVAPQLVETAPAVVQRAPSLHAARGQRGPAGRSGLAGLLRSSEGMRQAFALREVLGPPSALRDPEQTPFW